MGDMEFVVSRICQEKSKGEKDILKTMGEIQSLRKKLWDHHSQ